MLIFWRIVSFAVLLAGAVVFGSLWAKLLALVLGSGGLILFVLAPLPVLGGLFLIGYWIDRKLARMAKRKAREPTVQGW